MAISQPQATDGQDSPSHSLQHRQIATDPSASVKQITVDSSDNVGIGTDSQTAKLHVVGSADTEQLIVKGNATQNKNLTQWQDSDSNVLARVSSGGKIQGLKGIRGEANDWGDSVSGWGYGKFVAEHAITNDAGNFDATGNAAGEAYFYDSTNTPFAQADEDNANWIVIQSGAHKGAKAEIKEYISSTGVIIKVTGACWDEDLTNVDYSIYPSPQFIASDCYSTHIHTGTEGDLHIANCGGKYTGDVMVGIEGTFNSDNSDLMHLKVDADGHSNVDGLQMFYKTGDLQAGDNNQAIQISVDETGATGGEVDLLYLETTNATAAMEKHAIHVGTGFDTALTVSGATADDMDYAYEVLADHTATDRLTEFTTAGGANDVEIFDADNDYILIGNDVVFEVLEVVLAVNSSKGIVPTFEYSTGDGTWSTLVVDDGTQGFTTSGLIDWTAPIGWAKTSHADGASGAITEGYYIRIARTYTPTIPTLPTESYFKIYLEQAGNTGMKIDGQGVIKLPYLSATPASPENGMMWMESDGLHIYYGGAEKTVAGT